MTIFAVFLALLFAFFNGHNDSPALVAPVISTRAISRTRALLLTAAAQFIGPFLFGTAVARTMSVGLIGAPSLPIEAVVAALIAAVAWIGVTGWTGLPSSSSHALVGGLVGAAVAAAGWGGLHLDGVAKVLVALTISPPLGLLLGYLVVRLSLWFTREARPSVNEVFRRGQIPALAALALSHGTSDAPKSMGMLVLGLMAGGRQAAFGIPLWVKLACLTAFALGTLFAGWRQMRTVGGRIFHLRPVHGFSALAGGAAVVLGAGLLGGPISTTQVIASSVMGAGAGERVNQVRWMILRDMLVAWVLTIPVTSLLAAAAYVILVNAVHA